MGVGHTTAYRIARTAVVTGVMVFGTTDETLVSLVVFHVIVGLYGVVRPITNGLSRWRGRTDFFRAGCLKW